MYGKAKVGVGTPEEREINIIEYVSARFVDNRSISVANLEDNSVILSVENPESSERTSKQSMWLSMESFFGLLSASVMYLNMKNEDLSKALGLITEDGIIDFSHSENLDASKLSDDE